MATNTIDQLTAKANPVDADILVIADSADNNEMKQITIGSITADIGDGLIVDGSSSSTTTYSSTKIAADNATQDAALTAGLALKVAKAGDTMTGLFIQAKGADIASATALPLGTATGNYVDVTGTTTVTSITTATAGAQIKTRFTGILTLTHNATTLILPTGGNITTAAGDVAEWVSLGSGNWRCVNYTRADGTPLGGVNITSLTEDTTGDMDADFALVYDNSAGANRKQKPNVYRASDAEVDAGTSTTKFITPAQLDNYNVSTTLKNTWYTYPVPFLPTSTTLLTGWTTFQATFTNFIGAGGYTLVGPTTTTFSITSPLPGTGSTLNYSPTTNKDIRIKFRMKMESTSMSLFGWGMCVTAADIYTAQTSITNGEVRFIWNTSALYAQNANGTTATSTDITSGITVTDWNTYEIVFNPGTDIKFYINGTLKATHTTNLPTTGTLLLAIGSNDNKDCYVFPGVISIES